MFLFWDLAIKTGLNPDIIADWTPGMVYDLIFYRVNEAEVERAPKPPDQSVFDSF